MRYLSALGPAAAGLLFSLIVVPASAAPAVCKAPGVIVTTDPADDPTPEGPSPVGPTPAGQNPASQPYDVLSVGIAEPAHVQGKRLLAVTLQVGSLNPLPASSYWWVHLFVGGTDHFVSMWTPDPSSTDTSPVFKQGTVDNGSFSIGGPIEPESSYDADKGTITLVVRNADVGNPKSGSKIEKVTAEAGNYGGTIDTPVVTNPEDDTSNGTQGSYALTQDGACGILSGGGSPIRADTSQVSRVNGGADPVAAGVPRYQSFGAPLGIGADGSGGEYSIGFNPKTGMIMNISVSFTDPVFSAGVFKVVVPELRTPELPESCDGEWVDVSTEFRNTPQGVADPILWTDQDTGRTFAADDVTGPNPGSEWAFTDDDGQTWIPAGTGLVGEDHETVTSGPYPSGSPYEQLAINAGYSYTDADGQVHGKAVYWCVQDTVPDTCARSDDGGITWTQPQIAADGSTCSYLHGHLHIAADGAAYLPIKTCGGPQGGAYSLDAGDTWTQFTVPGSTKPTHGSDPSIGIDKDGTLYYCYVNGDGHPHMQVGHKAADGTLSWGLDTDLGKAHGLAVSAFPEAVGGDSGRAACGFLGTNGVNPENPKDVQGVDTYESLDFGGVWYLYVATTYDAGQHWVTVNATPDDPVQGKGGVWQNGGSNSNRNLLDFNEITLDDKGRVLFGYNDGCLGTCLDDHVGPIDSAHALAVMSVARQTGGRSLYAKFDSDPATNYADSPTRAPGQACLSGTRDDGAAHLNWHPAEPHGNAVTKYTIAATRSDTNATTYFTSTSTAADVPTDKAAPSYTFTVSATNGKGNGAKSLPLSLVSVGPPPAAQSACTGLGLTMVTSPPGAAYAEALPTGQDDLLAVYFAEPADKADQLVITMKVDNLNPAPPPGGRWMVYFKLPGSDEDLFVAMSTADGPTPVFNYGTRGAQTVDGPAVGTVTSVGMYTVLGTVDGTWNADGTIQFMLDTASGPFALKAGDIISNIVGVTRQTSSPSQTNNAGLSSDSAPGNGNYTIVKNQCRDKAFAPAQSSTGVILGGAFGLFTLLPLVGAVFIRRRKLS